MDLTKYKNAYQQAIGRKEVLEKAKVQFTSSIEKFEKRSLAVEQAQVIIQKTAQQTQNQLKFFIEDIVVKCMDSIFPNVYTFELLYEIKRGKTEANLKFTKEGRDIDILNSSGGGVADVVSMGLRLAVWSLGNNANVIIMDEGLKFLSRDLVPRMADVLHELSNKLGLQIIAVSHSPELIMSADRIFEVNQKGGISYVSLKMS